ncbi:hypothetical protein FJO69_02905, partial [[Mycoplasma] falconis]
YAISGKLTKQLPSDSSVEDLLALIKKEKEKLIAEKKIKANKTSSYIYKKDNKWYEEVGGKVVDITEQIPFKIRDNWVWNRMGQVGKISSGLTPNKEAIFTYSRVDLVPFFKVSSMNDPENENILQKTNFYVPNKYKIEYPSIVFPKNGGAIYTNKRRVLLNNGSIDLNCSYIYPFVFNMFNYLYFWFSNINLSNFIVGTAVPTINSSILSNLLLPLPPLEEQQRIVNKLETVLPLIEKINK